MNQTRHYPPEPASVTSARRFVVDCLRGYPQELTDTAELLVSELATNALRHTGSDFTVTITSSEARIRVAVTDPAAGEPHKRHPTVLEPNGRGLHIVDALSDSWKSSRPAPRGRRSPSSCPWCRPYRRRESGVIASTCAAVLPTLVVRHGDSEGAVAHVDPVIEGGLPRDRVGA